VFTSNQQLLRLIVRRGLEIPRIMEFTFLRKRPVSLPRLPLHRFRPSPGCGQHIQAPSSCFPNAWWKPTLITRLSTHAGDAWI